MVRAHWIPLAALALSACFVDPGKSSTAGDGTDTSAESTAAPTGATTTTTTTNDATTSTPTTGSVDPTTGSATTGPLCGARGQPCDDASPCCGCLTCIAGSCKPDAAACELCSLCDDDGACRAAPDGDSCDLVGDPCEQTAFGVEDGVCYARLPGGGLCDGGACISGGCAGKGAAVFSCPACVRDDHKCQPGATLVDVTLADFCHVNEPAPNCTIRCNSGMLYDAACDAQGGCFADDMARDACAGNYACNPEGTGCNTTCTADADCQVGFVCELNFGACVP